jgi:hypothetical protein
VFLQFKTFGHLKGRHISGTVTPEQIASMGQSKLRASKVGFNLEKSAFEEKTDEKGDAVLTTFSGLESPKQKTFSKARRQSITDQQIPQEKETPVSVPNAQVTVKASNSTVKGRKLSAEKYSSGPRGSNGSPKIATTDSSVIRTPDFDKAGCCIIC